MPTALINYNKQVKVAKKQPAGTTKVQVKYGKIVKNTEVDLYDFSRKITASKKKQRLNAGGTG
jgi:hypothetical protein